jgi:hypothetical protein
MTVGVAVHSSPHSIDDTSARIWRQQGFLAHVVPLRWIRESIVFFLALPHPVYIFHPLSTARRAPDPSFFLPKPQWGGPTKGFGAHARSHAWAGRETGFPSQSPFVLA